MAEEGISAAVRSQPDAGRWFPSEGLEVRTLERHSAASAASVPNGGKETPRLKIDPDWPARFSYN